MDGFFEVGLTDDHPVGRARVVQADGMTLALCRNEKGFFAVDGVCPHRGGPLGEGDVMGDEIVCPWHFWAFRLDSGETCDPAGPRIGTHEVRIEGNRILVRPRRTAPEDRGDE